MPLCQTFIKHGRNLVVKRALSDNARVNLRRQIDLLRRLARRFSIPVPCMETWDTDGASYTFLPGTPLASCRLSADVPKDLPLQLAASLAQLHSIPPRQLALPPAETPRKAFAGMFARVRSVFDVPIHLVRTCETLIQSADWPPRCAVVHGDFHEGNILMFQGRISGILDWSYCHEGNPGEDFIFHLLGHGPDSLRRLLQCYEERGGICWPNMERHIGLLLRVYPVRYAARALAENSPALSQQAQRFLLEPPSWISSSRL